MGLPGACHTWQPLFRLYEQCFIMTLLGLLCVVAPKGFVAECELARWVLVA